MVNSPHDQSHLQFSIRILGDYTKAVTELKVGEHVQILGPFGGFVIDENRDLDIVMLAGGIGITPLISIVHYVSNLQLPNKIKLIYSVKSQDDIPFVKQLNDLAASNPNFSVYFVISEGPVDKLTGCKVYSGRVTSEIIDETLGKQYEGRKYFVCGPPQFMKAISRTLKSSGVGGNSIVTESFHGGANGQPGNIRSWPFNIYVFGAVSIAAASLAVMLNDLIARLPASSMWGTSSLLDSSNSTNSRQAELDKLVNGLPSSPSSGGSTDAASKAASQNTSATSTSGGSSTATSATSATNTAPATTTTTVSTPKCTTTQSGVTTCI
jgi:ferredoxin-NADP reductase